MDTEDSAVQPSTHKVRRRSVAVGGLVAFFLAAGAMATVAAAAASLLVESVLVKRVLWVVVALAVSVGAGLWRATHSFTASPQGYDRLPYAPKAGSPR